jgi:tetratricopeptide (TPR) repeat protein/TolB-like protein
MSLTQDNDVAARWHGLRQHPAVQAAAVYLGASWALIQVADIFFPDLDIVRSLGIGLAAGLPVVVGLVWFLSARAARAGDASGPVRRRRRYGYALALGLVAIGAVFWWLRPSILGAVNPDAQVIAVLPFNTSGSGVELLGEGMVDLLSTNLDAVGVIRTVDPRTVLHRWRQRGAEGGLDLDGALALGRDVEAGSVLLGSVVAAGPEVRMTARLYSVRGSELATAQVEGPADSVLALVDRLTLAVLRKIWLAHEPIPNLRVSALTTDDPDAIRAYLEGQQHYRRSRWDSAIAAFRRAVERDSTFALAQYRLGLSYGWSIKHGGFGSPDARRHAGLAIRYGGRLPTRERTLVAAHSLFEDGELAAHDTLVRYVARYPDDPEGWYMLADVRFHASPLLALDYEEIFGPFDRVLELDRSLAPAIIHPLELSTMIADSARFYVYLAALEAAADPAQVEPWRQVALFFERPDSAPAALSRTPELQRHIGTLLVGAYRSSRLTPDVLLPGLAAVQAQAGESGRLRLMGVRAMVLASLGRLNEARSLYDSLWALAPGSQEAFQSVLPVWAGYADRSFADRAFAVFEDPPPVPRAQPLFRYARVIDALTRGESGEARRLAEDALAQDTLSYPASLPSLFRAAIGWADVMDGDTVGGATRLRTGLAGGGYASTQTLVLGGALRFALAATLAARPDTRAEGIRRLRYGLWSGDIVYFPSAYMVLGRALEAAGDPAGAAQAYSRFIRLWEDADPELQPRVESTRRALERLTGEQAQ